MSPISRACATIALLIPVLWHLTSGAADAQQTQSSGQASAAPADTVALRFVENIELDKAASQPGVPVKARFTDVVKDQSTTQALQQVDISGVLAVSPEAGVQPGASLRPSQLRRFSGRVVWTAVALQKPDQGINRREELNSPLVSDFGVDATRVASGTVVKARGDVNGAVTTALKLFNRTDEEKKAEEEAAAKKPEEKQAEAQGGDRGRGAVQAASPAKSNDLAANFRPAAPQIVTEAAEPVVGTTTEGCPPRVDLANEMVTIQNRLSSNGVPQGACSDSTETFPLKRSFTGCTDEVDKPAAIARPTYRRYWVDAGGTTQYVDAECQPDTDQTFDLVEDKGACTVDVNLSSNTASVRTQLVYTNRTNQKVVVEDCRVGPSAQTAPIVASTIGCSLRHDFAAGASHQQQKKTYDLDGLTYTVEACSDTGVSYAHTKVTNVCNPVVDFTSNKAFPQYRTQIDVDGVTQYINDCTPDQALAQDLQKTGSGCENQYFHNISASQSFGAARWYHTLGGSTNYVTVCIQDDAVVYAHQEETTGYQNNDTTKISKPLTRIHFMGPNGDVEVSGPQVRDGAPELPYTLQGQSMQFTGQASYTGCDKYLERANYNNYLRADNTVYSEYASPASPSGPTNACSVAASWAFTSVGGYSSQCVYDPGGCAGDSCSPAGPPCPVCGASSQGVKSCSYNGSMTRTRDDGQPVNNGTASKSYSATVCSSDPWGGGTGNPCEQPPSSGRQNTWNVELGWF